MQRHGPLPLPALRASMGDWVYYICFMTLRDVALRIYTAEELYTAPVLRELLQRTVSGNRRNEISSYLLSQPQRFFNSLVVGSFGGHPKWHELAVHDPQTRVPSWPPYMEGSLGVLTLEGTERLFAIDGQHRVVGIREAVRLRPELGQEEVAMILVPGVTSEQREHDPQGFERTRRLFTTLNRHAKAVTTRDIIALDEDDVVAIVTRFVLDTHPLARGRISLNRTSSLSRSDRTNFTSVVALYDALNTILRDREPKAWSAYRRSRPSDDELEGYTRSATSFLDSLGRAFPCVGRLRGPGDATEAVSLYRHPQGGHLVFRPVGLLLVTKAMRLMIDDGLSSQVATERLAGVPMDLAEPPWAGLLWDLQNQRMITDANNQRAALWLLYRSLGGDLARVGVSDTQLRKELAGLLNRPQDEVALPIYWRRT